MRFDLWFHVFGVDMGVRYGQTAFCCVAQTCGAACQAEQRAPTGGAAKAMRNIGAWFVFLPPESTDLSPIEMPFSKREALIRNAAAQPDPELWQAVGHLCDLLTDEDCHNSLRASGSEYKTD